jgi:nucleoside-diphosphate-sugar epimerase
MSFHLVLGYGPAGAATARLLAGKGAAVRVVTRSARPPEPGIEHLALDITDGDRLTKAAAGASVIYNCASPPYQRWTRDWPPLADAVNAAAEATGAVLVVLSNLYGYGPVEGVISEDLPLKATDGKGKTRAAIWLRILDLHNQGRIRAVEVRASDFFGPGVTDGGHLADRVVPPLLRGRTIRVLGDPDTPHSWTYLPDTARALVRVAEAEDAWGRPWHVPTGPPQSIRAMVGKLAAQAGIPAVKVRQLPPAMTQVLGLASPLLRELQEVRYQFDRPFIVDSTSYTTRFGETATSADEQVASTISWWKQRLTGQHANRVERTGSQHGANGTAAG